LKAHSTAFNRGVLSGNLIEILTYVMFCYFINGRKIGSTDIMPYLSVDIDLLLKLYAHIKKIIGKVYSCIGALFKGFASHNITVLKQAC